jgi:hypothetical protein
MSTIQVRDLTIAVPSYSPDYDEHSCMLTLAEAEKILGGRMTASESFQTGMGSLALGLAIAAVPGIGIVGIAAAAAFSFSGGFGIGGGINLVMWESLQHQ